MNRLLAAVLYILIIFAACEDNRQAEENKDTEEQTNEEKTGPVQIFGEVLVRTEEKINLDFTAKIVKIHVKRGEAVGLKDVLVMLDLQDITAQIRKKEHELEVGKLKLKNLEQDYAQNNKDTNVKYQSLVNSIDITKKELAQLRDEYLEKKDLFEKTSDPDIRKLLIDIDTSEQDFKNAEESYGDSIQLFDTKSISEQELKNSRLQYEQKKASYENLKLSLESTLLNKTRELEKLELSISQKESELSDYRLQLENLSTPEITNIEIQRSECGHLGYELSVLHRI